jgi:hypothetical protein
MEKKQNKARVSSYISIATGVVVIAYVAFERSGPDLTVPTVLGYVAASIVGLIVAWIVMFFGAWVFVKVSKPTQDDAPLFIALPIIIVSAFAGGGGFYAFLLATGI